jgi:hypothetical protein
MARLMQYGDYIITTHQEKPGQWKAHVRRADGKEITTEPYGPSCLQYLSTKTYFSEKGATEEAKAMIDGGGMK